MNKFFRNIIIAALAISPAIASANPLLGETNYDFIRNAIAQSLRIVHATYDVATADLSGRFCAEGDSVYGRSYSLAVISDRGILLSPVAGKPWDFDHGFIDLRNDSQYTPVVHDHTFSLLSNPAQFTKVPLDETSIVLPAYDTTDSPLYVATTEKDLSDKALPCYDPQGKVDGFAIWIVNHATNNIAQNADLLIKVTSTPITFSESDIDATISPVKTQGSVIGGIYLVPQTIAPGVVKFQLAGVIVPSLQVNQPWRVVKIPQE